MRNVKEIWISAENVLSLYERRGESPKQAGFLLFFWPKKVDLHYELVISTLLRNFFLGVCGFFLRNVGSFFADAERLKVKRYLFSQGADLTFQGSTQVNF